VKGEGRWADENDGRDIERGRSGRKMRGRRIIKDSLGYGVGLGRRGEGETVVVQ
jgi:hypothetical protein